MEKEIIHLTYDKKGDNKLLKYSFFFHYIFNSINSLKKFLDNPSSFYDINKEVEEIENEIYYYDEDIDINENINSIKERYNNILNGNYEFENLYFSRDPINSKEFKDIVELLKDKVKVLYLYNFSLQQITELINVVKFNDDVRFVTKYNYKDSCSKDELLDVVNFLNNIVSYVKRYDLSPLEISIFVYDLIRERKYDEVYNEREKFKNVDPFDDLSEAFSESRSISKIINSDKIVCAGFANLYSAILELLGIKSETVKYYPNGEKKAGHMSNIIYLKDEKYNIDGIFECDPTFDRIYDKDRNYDYKKTLNKYYHFANPVFGAFAIKKINDLTSNSSILSIINSGMKRIEKLLDLDVPYSILCNDLEVLTSKIEVIKNKMNCKKYNELYNYVVGLKDKISLSESYEKNEILKLLKEISKKIFWSIIPDDDFSYALYKVKLIEHSIDKDKYPLTGEVIKKSVDSRLIISDEIKKLYKDYIKRIEKDDELDIARTELISVFHKISNDNVDENPFIIKK